MNDAGSKTQKSQAAQDAAVAIEQRIGERDEVRKEAASETAGEERDGLSTATSRERRRQDNIEAFDAPE